MRSLEANIPTFMLQSLLITLLLWSTNFDMCNAKRGSHWRQSRPLSASLLKKKGKSHGYHGHNHHHSSNPKPKPKPASPTIPTPSPEVGTPPLPPPIQKAPYLKGSPPKAMSPPNPTPIVKIPSPQPQKGSSVFSVLDYGAKGDGSSDDTEVTFQTQ